MALPYHHILEINQVPQPQIIVFQNITKVISQSYIKRTIVNPQGDFPYLHLFALVLVLILGFLLGIGVMLLSLRWKKWRTKGHKAAHLKKTHSQTSTAESDTSSNLAKCDSQNPDSRSTSAKSSPSLASETDIRDTMAPIFLENGQYNSNPDPMQRNGLISELPDPSEMKLSCIPHSFHGKNFAENRDNSEGSNQCYGFVECSPDDHQQLLELKLKQEYTQSSRPATIPEPETTEKLKLHQNSQDITSMKEESEIQVHQKDGKIVKIERTVNVTEYCESKTEELKNIINSAQHALHKRSEVYPRFLALENGKASSPSLENELQLGAERKLSSDFKEIKPISPSLKEIDQALNPQRQTSPAKELNEEKSNGADVIRILRSPSPSCSSKPQPTSQGFCHLTGFFEKVFGDKTLIGRGGFGEVFKVNK